MRKEQIGNAILYLGDSREILPTMPVADAIITDPVWPNCPAGLLEGSADPDGLFRDVIGQAPDCRQILICMRSDCDPRILRHVPSRFPFQQCIWLPYVVPGYAGRVLTNEIAYAFGKPIPSSAGRRVIPSQAPKVQPWNRVMQQGETGHPCPRDVAHQTFLMDWFSNEGALVIDPFMGSGTTGIAAAKLGRKFIGIEIEERYFDLACRRIDDALKQPDLFIAAPEQPAEQFAF
jgi:site-specific DNA-methyltransferase (adenine-specific)